MRPFPPRNSRPNQGTINHWFPLKRPYLLGGVALGGSGPLDCHDFNRVYPFPFAPPCFGESMGFQAEKC